MQYRILLFCIAALTNIAFADLPTHINIGLSSIEDKDGKKYYCVSALEDTTEPVCYALTEMPTQNVTSSVKKNYPRFQKVEIADLGLLQKGDEVSFSVKISWKAAGAGRLAISGPEGTIIALGMIKNGKIIVAKYGDASMTEEFDRSLVFGETDVVKLNLITAAWIEKILPQALKKHLLQAQSKTLP